MELYFAPLACSLATRISLYETGADATYRQVNTKTKRTLDGADFLAVNPLGQVPVLRTDDGELLTENPAILQFVADRYPDARLAPEKGMERYRLQQWLNFITTELHKVVFLPLLDRTSGEGAKTYARSKTQVRLDYLDAHLKGHDYLLDRFSVADAYLVTVLNWSTPSGVTLADWPAVAAYFKRLQQRPSIARAFAEELALYAEEQARKVAA
jgi:glutathione S-transferase